MAVVGTSDAKVLQHLASTPTTADQCLLCSQQPIWWYSCTGHCRVSPAYCTLKHGIPMAVACYRTRGASQPRLRDICTWK